MKTGRRLLAMLLVLAMLLSNLPMGAIAAELEELLPEPTEAVTETEQPAEVPVEETDTPETTAAPSETEAVEETTEEVAEEAEETTEAATEEEAPVVVETLEASEEAVMETVAEEENPPYLTFANIYEDENGLHVDTNYYGTEFVNPYGSVAQVAFFLNEYVDGEWVMTCVQVDALDDSISLELVDEAVDGADCYYNVTTNVAGVTSGVCYDDVTMNVGTWPFHFHFSTEASNSADSEGLIYELDLDHLGEDDSFDVYAVMFHEDFTWSDVRLSQDSQRFASLYKVSDSIYRINISGVARKHVMENGYVMLEVLSTQTDNNTGDVNQYGYMYLPIFMAPQTSLVMVGLGDDGDGTGYYEDPDYISYQMMFCPGKEWLCVFYLREWDAAAGEMKISRPVDPALLQVDGDLTFTALDPSEIQEGQENGAYFVRLTTDTFDQDLEVYVELEDGTRAGGVYIYTHRYFIEYYDSEIRSNDTVLTGYYVNPDGENVLYVGFSDADCGGTHRGVPSMDGYFGTIEETGTYGSYKITLSDELVNLALRGYPQYVQVDFEIDYEDGSYERHGAGISVTAHEEDYISYLTNGWLEWSEEGLIEGEWHDNNSFDIVPGDVYPHIYYVHTWDSEQGCYVEKPVPADELYCDDDSFTIAAMPAEDYKAGEANADCFVWVTASEWDHESEIYTEVDGVRSEGVRITTYLPQLGFYSSEELSYDTFLRGEYIVNPEAEENAFYVGLYADDWVIDDEPWLADENMASLLSLEKRNDKVIKVTLTQEGIEAVTAGEQLWPGIQFNMCNTVENQIQFVDFGGLCVRAEGGDVTPSEEGFYFRFLENWDEGFFDPHNGDCFSTNIAKFDEYNLYFYLKLWDGEQYVEIPVHPEHDEGIILNRVEDVKDGEENGEYFYAVSIADDALDTVQEVWVEHEGVTYTMPITSGLHGVAVYTTEEPSHDTRLVAPVDVDPFGENVVYLAANSDWTITDVVVDDWAAEYVELEVLSETAWSVTLTKEGIDQNMSQWILDIGMNVDIQNVEDPNWTENNWVNVAFSRENLEILGNFSMESGDYGILEGGYIREWFTGEYGSDEEGNTWEIWDAEVLDELPAGLTYDYATNTLTMEDYVGEWMNFGYGWSDDDGTFWKNLPSDTLTIELIGDNNALATENNNALDIHSGLNLVITGDGSLLLKTVNDYAQDEDNNARTFNTVHLNGGNLTVKGNASVTVEIAGEGDESCWDENGKIGERAGNMTALAMDHGQLYIKDNARLETVIPEGGQRNGSEDVGEENAIWGERFPGGYRGIADASMIISGGELVTQGIEFGSGYHDDGTYWTNKYAQTGGEVIIQANGWNNILEEDGVTLHTHYEGLTVRSGGTASITGGSLTVNVEATDSQLASSTYYEGIAIRGGELEIGGDAEVTVTANHESGNLVGVYCEDGTGKLNITGGTLNVNGTSGEGNGRLGIYLDYETVFTMSGGTINSEYADFINNGPAHITDGTINIGGMYLYNELYEDGFYPAWITGFTAGGPEFVIDGGEINITGGMFNADGMVAMNGGTMNINGGGLNVGTAFGFDGGEINIFNDGSNAEANVLIEEGHGWPSLRVDNYLSIAGGEGGGAPVLTIHNTMDLPTVVINGTYHQMAGSTVDITHTSTERPAIWVYTQFDEDGNPIVATDEEGNVIRDEEGNEILLTGSFLMNDGILNVMNPGDADAELIRAMESDPYSFVQFRGGETSFDTAQLFWNGEIHITENAVVEVKDAAIFANAGHLVMDDGLLLANEESAVCLGNAEMNGGRMELDNAMILVNSGFHFNNGEIVINNTDEAINTEAVFTSLAANTYFAIGDPEDPNSNPTLIINHNLTRCPAVLVNGTMHLMAGTVELNVPVTKAPAISISAPIFDENGAPIKTDDQGEPLGGEFLQNGGVLNISSADGENIAGVIAQEGSVFFMNGGEANLIDSNLVMSGQMFLYDRAVLNMTDGILRLYETASLEVDYGILNLDTAVYCGDDVSAALQSEVGSHILLNNGAINVTSSEDSFAVGMMLHGTFNQTGGAVNIEAPQVGLVVQDDTNISGGTMNIVAHGVLLTNDNGEYTAARALVAELGENPEAVLTISGGEQFVTAPDGGQHDAICYALNGKGMPIEITGGVQHLEGQYVYFGNYEDGKTGLHLAEDRVLYSLEDGTRPELLIYPFDGFSFEMFEDDNIPGDWDTGEGFDFLSKAVITTNKAGNGVTWEVNDGVLSFQGNGAMADYAAKIPAPWHMVREFITSAEMDSNLTYIGSYAFSTLSGLTDLIFLGEAPDFAEDAFAELVADATYPADLSSWTGDVRQNYGGEITWIPDRTLVEVVEILTDKEVLFSGEKTTLTAQLAPEQDVKINVIWELAEGDENYATLTVKNNVATVTAKTITEKHEIAVIARTEEGVLPMEQTLTLYPKAQSVSIFLGEDEVTGGKIKADLEEKLTLTATLNPADAEEYLDPAIIWTSSNNAIATVENGIVTIGEKTGTVKITATADDGSKKKAVVTITVVDMIDSVVIPEDSVPELVGGKSASFTAYDAEGNKLKTSQVTWSIDPEFAPYAAITTAGKLTTKVVQEAVPVTIRVASVDDPEIYDVHVVTICPAAFSMQIEKDDFAVTGDTIPVSLEDYDAENPPVVDLRAVFYPADALTNITWKTSSKAIATVDEAGRVTAAGKAGTVTITATDSNSKKSASVKLNFGVFAKTVLIEQPETTEIIMGTSMTLKATTDPAEGLTKSGVTWALKDPADKSYLTVSAAGVAKAAKTVYAAKKVTLVASSKDGYAEPAEITLTVLPKDATILVIKSGSEYLTNTTKTLNFNTTKSISLTAHTLGTDMEEKVTWTSSSKSVATVDNGVVNFLKTGTAKITATHADGRKAVVTLKIANQATGITITEKTSGASEGLTLAAGKTMNLAIVAEGVSKVAVTWTVSDSSLATITSGGKLTAAATVAEEQIVTVMARANDGSNEEDSMDVVLRPQVQGIQIHGLSGELTNCTVVHDLTEKTIQLSAMTFPEAASDEITWKSSNAKVAEIDPDSGKITCVKPGTVTITATAGDGSGKKATFKLTLVKKVTSLVMSHTEAVLAGGKSLTLKADAGDATDKSVTWSMTGDTAYVTLSAKGVLKASAVTAKKTVYVTATANDGSGVKGYCTVNIYPATTAVQIWHAGEATTSKTILEVPAGQTITLEGVSVPNNAANFYTWKSSGAAATVEDGKVTGVTAGKTVTITCTAADGTGKKATVKVKVVNAEISLWTYPIGKWGDPTTVNNLVSAFKAETGIQVNVEYLDYMTGDAKVSAAIEADAAPDLIMEGPERLVANWGASGKLVNIADLFDSADQSQIYTNVRNACFVDETTAYEYPLTMTAHCMAINKTVFEAAGAMQYINEETHTWNSTEDFFAAVQAVYEYTGTTVGTVYCGGQGGDQGTRALVNNLYGGTYTNADHTAYTWDSDENIQALKALYDCEGITYDTGIVGGDEIARFYNGTLNMAFCWNIMQQQNPNMADTGAEQTADGDEIMFMAFPADGDAQLQGGIWGFGIFDNGNSARIEAAKIFIKYFCDSEATAEAVSATGYFPVRSNVTEGWTNDSILAEYNCLMPLMGDYYSVADNWNEAREAWYIMLQEASMSNGSLEELTEIAARYTAQANG